MTVGDLEPGDRFYYRNWKLTRLNESSHDLIWVKDKWGARFLLNKAVEIRPLIRLDAG
jgi:hypothetical protein